MNHNLRNSKKKKRTTIFLLREFDDKNGAIYYDAAHQQIISAPIQRLDAIPLTAP